MSDVCKSDDDDLFSFDRLKLVEEPDSPLNSPELPRTLQNCEGYLTQLPLIPPNADKTPKTIADMVNILTLSDAQDKFSRARANLQGRDVRPSSGLRSVVYDERRSQVMKDQLRLAKKHIGHSTAPGVFGHVVLPGCLSFYTKDGKTYAASEGRWWLPSIKSRWIAVNIKVNQDRISLGKSSLLILRVKPGECGLIRDQGVEVMLDVGTHVFNSGTISYVGSMEFAAHYYFSHGRYHYLRVPRGMLAKVWTQVQSPDGKSVVPRLLVQGEHFMDNHLFRFEGLVACSKEHINHGSVHQVSVEKGYVAKILQDKKPRLLGEGTHLIESTDLVYSGKENVVSNNCIVHGTITILRVTLGQVALAWQDSEPVFIYEPGLYEYDSSDFQFVEFKDATERLIQLGAKKDILVNTGQVGVTYDQGLLKILPHGRHLINSSTHIFHCFLSTQQKSIRLATPLKQKSRAAKKSGQKSKVSFADDAEASGPNFVCDTKDLVKVGIRADVFYSIEDPEKCINRMDADEVEDLVRETAVATLANIIRSTALIEIAQSSVGAADGILGIRPPDNKASKESSSTPAAGSPDGVLGIRPPANEASDESSATPVPESPGSADGVLGIQSTDNKDKSFATPMFYEKVHDDFLSKLHDFRDKYGIDISNIRIESFQIMDHDLCDQISRQALTNAQIENEMSNLEGKSLISTTQERTAADVRNIHAQAEADALKTKADAENQRQIERAQAQSESLRIAARAKAEAEAEAILTRAKAEAEAIRIKAAAEAERAELLSRTSFGQQEALLNIYADMVVQSNDGVEKVVYLDSNNRDSPFSLGSLNSLNADLHSLSTMGVATGEHHGKNGKKKH